MHMSRYNSFDEKTFKVGLGDINKPNRIISSRNRELENNSNVFVSKEIKRKLAIFFTRKYHFGPIENGFSRDSN